MTGLTKMQDATLDFAEAFLPKPLADKYFNSLLDDISWQEEEIRMFGKYIKVPRLIAWHGDPQAEYKYSGVNHKPLPWDSNLLELKSKIESRLDCQFNSVLLNLYRNGQDSMSWHSDDEPELGKEPIVASISLGETRPISFRYKSDKKLKVKIPLTHGSLLVMAGKTQEYWQHAIPKSRKPLTERINLTFRFVH